MNKKTKNDIIPSDQTSQVASGKTLTREVSKFDMDTMRKAIDDYILAADVVLKASKFFKNSRLHYERMLSDITLAQGRELALGLDEYDRNGDSTALNRRRQDLEAVDEMRKPLHEKLHELRTICYAWCGH